MPLLSVAGARVSYLRTGAGPPVLLIHGAGVVGEGWRPQRDALAGRFTLLTFDNRGTGASTLDGGVVTVEAMAADALAIADAEGCDRFHVIGHSMGGLIAQQLALASPRRVLSLALLCTFLHGAQAARLTPSLLVTSLRMRIGTRAMRRRAFTELVMPSSYLARVDRAALAKDLRPLFGYDLAAQPAFVFRQVRAMSRFDVSGRLAQLAGVPTLVASAEHDRLALPAYGRALAAAIPGARYVELPDAGHAVTIQCASEVNALLGAHLAAAAAAAGR